MIWGKQCTFVNVWIHTCAAHLVVPAGPGSPGSGWRIWTPESESVDWAFGSHLSTHWSSATWKVFTLIKQLQS